MRGWVGGGGDCDSVVGVCVILYEAVKLLPSKLATATQPGWAEPRRWRLLYSAVSLSRMGKPGDHILMLATFRPWQL